jgi:hypothetical protein
MNLHLIVKKQLAHNETEASYTVHDMLHTLRRALYSYKLLVKNNVPSDINIKFSPTLMVNSRKLYFLDLITLTEFNEVNPRVYTYFCID